MHLEAGKEAVHSLCANPLGQRWAKIRVHWLVVSLLVLQFSPVSLLGQTTSFRRVVVAGPDSADMRYPATSEAVDFWNMTFAELGLDAPFGPVQFVQLEAAEDVLRSDRRALLELPGEIVIVLSDSAIVSFAAPLDGQGRYLIGLRTDRLPPLNLPNVSRNLVAHELGHALGLGHNDDRTKLMCGRPAPCRPDAFQSDEPRFFDLTQEERATLLRLHGSASRDMHRCLTRPYERAGPPREAHI